VAGDNRLFINAVFWILVPVLAGEICHLITGTGKTSTVAFWELHLSLARQGDLDSAARTSDKRI
jgi:hypothetical protein